MKNNRDRLGRPTFFAALSPLANAIANLPAARLLDNETSDREREIAAQRKRIAKQQRRLKREGRGEA